VNPNHPLSHHIPTQCSRQVLMYRDYCRFCITVCYPGTSQNLNCTVIVCAAQNTFVKTSKVKTSMFIHAIWSRPVISNSWKLRISKQVLTSRTYHCIRYYTHWAPPSLYKQNKSEVSSTLSRLWATEPVNEVLDALGSGKNLENKNVLVHITLYCATAL